MFKPRPRKKKLYPPGTFLPTPKRILAIIQLCLALSTLFWYSAQPFMGEYFTIKSQALLYEHVLGVSTSARRPIKENRERFAALPEELKSSILKHYDEMKHYAGRDLWIKVVDGLRALLIELPAFKLAWIFFSIVISVLLLLKVEGSKMAVWILPLITLFYGIDNRMYGKSSLSADAVLFPSESLIVQEYLDEPLKISWNEQKEQLQKGWNTYLIKNYLEDSDLQKSNNETAKLQVAEFNFTVARLDLLQQQEKKAWSSSSHEKSSIPLLGLYFIWNLLFAWRMSKK